MFSKPIYDFAVPYGIELSPKRLRTYILIALGITPVVKVLIDFVMLIYRRKRDMRSLAHFPGPPPHWFYGNLKDFQPGKSIIKRVEWLKTYGDAYTTHLGFNFRQVQLGSPQAIQAIMSTSEPKDFSYIFFLPWIGDGLLTSSGKKWARNRRLLTPAFHFDILKPYQALFCKSTHIMLEKWFNHLHEHPSKPIEIFDNVSLLTLDSLMKCIFGIDRDFQNLGHNDPYVKKIYEISMLISARFRNPWHHNKLMYYLSYNGFKFRRACEFVHKFSRSVIDEKRKELNASGSGGLESLISRYIDFIDVLLTCRDSAGNGLSDQDIEAEVDTFMFEGHDTTASGISWCLYNLALHPEYQHKCRQEINNVLGDRNEVTWEDLSKLNYLTMCLKESLRITPPVPGIGRNTTENHTLYDGRIIPKGTYIILGIYSVHLNPDTWPNPNEYNPERFTSEAIKDRHPYSYIPFSAGPRNCIGQHFAMNEMKTVLALILKKFQLAPDEQNPPDQIQSLVLRSGNGMRVYVTPL